MLIEHSCAIERPVRLDALDGSLVFRGSRFGVKYYICVTSKKVAFTLGEQRDCPVTVFAVALAAVVHEKRYQVT